MESNDPRQQVDTSQVDAGEASGGREAPVPSRPARRYTAMALVVAVAAGAVLGGAITARYGAPARAGHMVLPQQVAERSKSLTTDLAVTDSEANTIAVVEAATASVVQVRVTKTERNRPRRLPSPPFPGWPSPPPDEMPDDKGRGHGGGAQPEEPPAPREFKRQGSGSGFVFDASGLIVTNNHVVEDATSVEVVFPDGKKYPARVLGTDRLSDLGVLKIDAPAGELHPLQLADSDAVRVGQKAIAIGSPLGGEGGLGLDRSPSVTQGIVSAKDRSLPIYSREGGSSTLEFSIDNLIQTDAAINPGNSGGPLLNSRGQVIGVNTAIVPQAQGIGFAIPSNIVRRVAPILAQGKAVERPQLGLTYQGLDTLKERLGAAYDQLGLPQNGALVMTILPGSAAEKAGLRGSDREKEIDGQTVKYGGDIITAVNGVPVNGDKLRQEVLKYQPGDTVELTVIRDGQTVSVKLTLGKR